MRLLLAIVLFGCCVYPLSAQTPRKPLRLHYQFGHSFERKNPQRAALFRVALPVTEAGKQEVHSVRFHPEPHRIFTYGSRKYAEWIWNSPQDPVRLQVHIEASLTPVQFPGSPRTSPEQLTPDERKAYLAWEPYVETTHPELIALAHSIPHAETPEEQVSELLKAVTTSLRYSGYDTTDQGALKAKQSGQGDCTEYADLLVALCRIKGLPSRSRLCILHQAKKIPLHTVVEVFLPKVGSPSIPWT